MDLVSDFFFQKFAFLYKNMTDLLTCILLYSQSVKHFVIIKKYYEIEHVFAFQMIYFISFVYSVVTTTVYFITT